MEEQRAIELAIEKERERERSFDGAFFHTGKPRFR